MESSSAFSDYGYQGQGSKGSLTENNKAVVFFLIDLADCKFHYAGGSPNFEGYRSSELLTTQCKSLKKLLHPNDVDYLLRVYKHFVKISKSDTKRQPPQKWSTEIRVISESGCWDWVELSFDVLSYTEDNAIDKIFCTLKEEAPLHTPDRELSNVGLFAEKPDKSRVKDTLGDREIQVLHLIADGYSDKQIANKLEISIHTSVRHRKNLIEKFGVKNTAELIKEASKVFWL